MLIELAPSRAGWPYWDKVQHATVFVTLCTLGYLAFPQKRSWIYVGLAMYGALIEWLQGALTITRTPSLNDWIADIVGILLCVIIATFFKRHAEFNN